MTLSSILVSGFSLVLAFCVQLLGSPALLLCKAAEPKGTFYLQYPIDFNTKTPINTSLLWKKSVQGLDKAVLAKLKPLFGYQFLLPEQSLRAGLGYVGAARRLRRFVQVLLDGSKQLKIGVVGGSISRGQSASKIGVTDWFSIVVNWLVSMTKAPVVGRNGCRGGTPSSYMVFCLEDSVDPDVDLVFVEYSLNDGYDDSIANNSIVMAKEQLLRRLLMLPGQPAVVLVQVPHVWPWSVHPFFYTPEDVEGALAAYYDVSSVSFRTSMFLLNVYQPTDGFLWNQTYTNRHPIDAGHKAIADLAVHLIQEVAVGLLIAPVSRQELEWRQMPLPPPMHEDNYEPQVATCLVGPNLVKMTLSTEGWEWVNEGTDSKPKWGFVSTTPGSPLVLRLGRPGGGDAAAAAAARHGNATFPVLIQFLTSYTSMGMSLMECEGGCQCWDKVDGYRSDGARVSSTHMVRLNVKWVERSLPCDLRITVLNETHNDGHKFKVSGVVFAATNSLTSSHGVRDWDAR